MKRKNLYTLLILLFFIILLTFFIQHRYFETLITIKDKPDELYFGKKDKISAIPNIIWAYWDNENLPEIVKICTESWKKHNPDYQIVILNNRTLKHYLPNIDISSMPRSKDFPARFSDFVRIFILEKYGGIWIDASSICNQPFYWVNSIQNHTKCECVCYYIEFTEEKVNKDTPVIENWFIAAVPGSSFIKDWKDEFLRTNDFETVDLYLENIKKNGTDISKVKSPDYLAMHCSAQVILQKNVGKYKLCCFNASLGPFRFWITDNNSDDVKAVNELLDKEKCKKFYDLPFLKFVGGIRSKIESHPNMQNLKYYIDKI
jgi:hypothetical protein